MPLGQAMQPDSLQCRQSNGERDSNGYALACSRGPTLEDGRYRTYLAAGDYLFRHRKGCGLEAIQAGASVWLSNTGTNDDRSGSYENGTIEPPQGPGPQDTSPLAR